DWTNSTVLGGDVVAEVTALKREMDGEIVVPASYRLGRTLLRHDLVDELRLVVFPVVLGAGERLFGAAGGTGGGGSRGAGVAPAGEGGLLGVAVSPGFASDRAVFVAYTSATDNRVVRLHARPDGTVDGAAQDVVVSGIAKAGIHNGGGLAFGPDGFLYVG